MIHASLSGFLFRHTLIPPLSMLGRCVYVGVCVKTEGGLWSLGIAAVLCIIIPPISCLVLAFSVCNPLIAYKFMT